MDEATRIGETALEQVITITANFIALFIHNLNLRAKFSFENMADKLNTLVRRARRRRDRLLPGAEPAAVAPAGLIINKQLCITRERIYSI